MVVVDLGEAHGVAVEARGMARKLQKCLESTARPSELGCFVLRVVVVSVLNGYAGQADLVAKLDRSLSQAECRVSVAASSHAIDVGMRHDEESQKQILVLIRR